MKYSLELSSSLFLCLLLLATWAKAFPQSSLSITNDNNNNKDNKDEELGMKFDVGKLVDGLFGVLDTTLKTTERILQDQELQRALAAGSRQRAQESAEELEKRSRKRDEGEEKNVVKADNNADNNNNNYDEEDNSDATKGPDNVSSWLRATNETTPFIKKNLGQLRRMSRLMSIFVKALSRQATQQLEGFVDTFDRRLQCHQRCSSGEKSEAAACRRRFCDGFDADKFAYKSDDQEGDEDQDSNFDLVSLLG